MAVDSGWAARMIKVYRDCGANLQDTVDALAYLSAGLTDFRHEYLSDPGGGFNKAVATACSAVQSLIELDDLPCEPQKDAAPRDFIDHIEISDEPPQIEAREEKSQEAKPKGTPIADEESPQAPLEEPPNDWWDDTPSIPMPYPYNPSGTSYYYQNWTLTNSSSSSE